MKSRPLSLLISVAAMLFSVPLVYAVLCSYECLYGMSHERSLTPAGTIGLFWRLKTAALMTPLFGYLAYASAQQNTFRTVYLLQNFAIISALALTTQALWLP